MENPYVYLTSHAKRRFRERMKLPTRAMRRIVIDALTAGQTVEEMPNYARLKLETQQERFSDKEGAFVRIHRDFVFVFFDTNPEVTSLLTLYPLDVPAVYLDA